LRAASVLGLAAALFRARLAGGLDGLDCEVRRLGVAVVAAELWADREARLFADGGLRFVAFVGVCCFRWRELLVPGVADARRRLGVLVLVLLFLFDLAGVLLARGVVDGEDLVDGLVLFVP
jgi:hypothetical protein